MKNKNQRIALIAVLVLAGGAYGVDHFILSPTAPSPARAELAVESPKTPTAAPIAAAAPASATTSAVTEKLAALSAASQNSEPGDAFAMPQTWVAAAFPPPEPTPVVVAAAEKPAIEDGKFTLSSVASNPSDPNHSAARINNRLVTVGEKINGYTLIGVGTNPDNTPFAMLLGPKGAITVSLKSAENTRTDIADTEPVAGDPAPK